MGFGREAAICEYIEIMQILPGSSDDSRLINANAAICNIDRLVRRLHRRQHRLFQKQDQ